MRKKVILLVSAIALLGVVLTAGAYWSESHGDRQVRRMLRDRPNMAVYKTKNGEEKKLTPDDKIWKWAAEAYGKRINGSVTVWDSSPPNKDPQIPADHTIPDKGQKGKIRVRQVITDHNNATREASFQELWNSCIFELLNIQGAVKFLELYERAFEKPMTKENFVQEAEAIEYSAWIQLKAFGKNTWKPWANIQNTWYDPDSWGDYLPDTYAELKAEREKEGLEGSKYWSQYYDQNLVSYYQELEEYNKKLEKYNRQHSKN